MAKRKRGQNEGSIFEEAPGKWRAVVSLGWKAGRRVRKTFTATTRREVQEKLTKALRSRQLGYNVAPEKRTVRQWLEEWLEAKKPDVAPATCVSYEGAVRVHLAPALGNIRLSKLRSQQIQQFKLANLAGGVSPSLVKYNLVVLRMALKEACKLDLVPRNVAMLVDFPSVQRAEIRPFTVEEAQRFLAAVEGHSLEAFFSVALALGLRKGEALALQWRDIGLGNGLLSVRRSLQRIKLPGERKGALRLAEPKRGSHRTINLPQIAVAALYRHRTRQDQQRELAGSAWRETAFVFTSRIGTPVEPRKVSGVFSEILKRAGLPRIRLHDLRHTCASLLLAQGVSFKAIQEILGHSDIRITMNLYAHLYPEAKREAADRMDAILKPVATSLATLGDFTKPN
jgi:integrase